MSEQFGFGRLKGFEFSSAPADDPCEPHMQQPDGKFAFLVNYNFSVVEKFV